MHAGRVLGLCGGCRSSAAACKGWRIWHAHLQAVREWRGRDGRVWALRSPAESWTWHCNAHVHVGSFVLPATKLFQSLHFSHLEPAIDSASQLRCQVLRGNEEFALLCAGTLWGLSGVRKGIGGATIMRTLRDMAPMMASPCTPLKLCLSKPAGTWESLTCLSTPGLHSI